MAKSGSRPRGQKTREPSTEESPCSCLQGAGQAVVTAQFSAI